MKSRLIKFFENTNFFSLNQFGFTANKSTEMAIERFMTDIYNNVNDSRKSSEIFIDFSKAFDLVEHDILLDKLQLAGIRGIALRWFERTQKVKIQSCLSGSKLILKGVPQGSVLSA